MSSFILSDSAKRDLEEKAKQKCKELAIEARELMTKEYLSVIENFYSEYEPKYYVRHYNNKNDEGSLKTSGLGHTFEKYYKNSHGTSYSGGIYISTDNMYSDYEGSKSDVLNSFLNGYHGLPSLNIMSSIETYNHMVKYREILIGYFSDKLKL